MRNAISYCEMRVSIAGSPTSPKCARLSACMSSSIVRRASRLTPAGLLT
jgi:hypothetical protein